MPKHSLSSFNKQYEEIMTAKVSGEERDRQLADLMTEMERTFQIPALQDPEWEAKNRPVIALYRKISMSRDL